MGLWIHRILSLMVAAFYVVLGAIWEGGRGFWMAASFSLFALAFIWFADELGEYLGPWMMRAVITAKSPGWLLRFMGWVLLLMPVWVFLVSAWARSYLDSPPTPAR